MSSSSAMTKSRHDLRRGANRCIYDQRDNGGPAHDKPVKGGRCQCCWDLKLLSAKCRRREVSLDEWQEKLRGADDPFYVAKCKAKVAGLKRALSELEVIRREVAAKLERFEEQRRSA